jgi:CHAT domain-containing protein
MTRRYIKTALARTLLLLLVGFISNSLEATPALFGPKDKKAKQEEKFRKNITKCEEDYHKGDYIEAQHRMNRVMKDLIKDSLSYTQNFALAAIYHAKYLEALGNLKVAGDSVENAIFYFNNLVTPDSSKYRECLLTISDCYRSYGKYLKAYEYILKLEDTYLGDTLDENMAKAAEEADEILEQLQDSLLSAQEIDSLTRDSLSMNFDANVLEAEKVGYTIPVKFLPIGHGVDSLEAFTIDERIYDIQIARGFYRESEALINDLIKFQQNLTKRRWPNPDSTAKKTTIKLKKKEFKKRQEHLAMLYVKRAEFYRTRGDYKKAANMYFENEKLLEELVKKKHLPYIMNYFGKTVMAEQERFLVKPYKEYRKIRNLIIRSGKVSNFHAFHNEVAEKEIQSYIDFDNNPKAKNLLLTYKLDNMHKFGSDSYQFLHAMMLQNEFDNRSRKYKKALKKEVRLKEGIEEVIPIDHNANIKMNEHFYDFYHKNARIEEALIERENNVWVAKLNYGVDAPRYSIEELKLADLYIENQDQFNLAKSTYEEHFDGVIRYQLNDQHPDFIEFLRSYSELKTYIDQYDEAYDLMEHALRVSADKYGAQSELYGLVLVDLADISILKGDFDKAETQLENAEQVIREANSKKSFNYYIVLKSLAELYMINGKYDEAKDAYKRAYKLLKKTGEVGSDADVGSSMKMAELYITTGRYKAAEDILAYSIDLNERKYGIDHFRLTEPLALYGQLKLITGDFIESEKYVRRALDISRLSLGDTSVAYMDNLSLLAEIYNAMGNYEEAERIYTDALELIQKKFGEGNIREAEILKKLAETNFLSENADLDKINKLLEKAKEIVITNFDSKHPKYAELLEYQARVFMLFGKYTEAEQNVLDAQTIWIDKFGKNHINSANNEMLLGDVRYLEEKFDEAEDSYNDAANVFENIFDENHPGYINARSKVARSFYAKGDLNKAKKVYDETTEKYLNYLQNYFPSLSEKEKNKYWNSIKTDFEIYNSLALDMYADNPKAMARVYDFKLATKAILLSSSAKIRERIVNSGDGDLIYRFQLYNERKEMLTRGLSMSPEERAEAGVNMNQLEKEINLLEKGLSKDSEDFAKAFETEQYEWKDVKKTLEKDKEFALEIVRFRYFNKTFTDSVIYAALIVNRKSKKAPELVVLPNGNQMDGRNFKYYRNGIKYKANDKFSYGIFWKAIDERIPDNTKIYLSADGIYNQLNVETFEDTAGRFVIDKNDLYIVSNTKDLVLNAQKGYEERYDNSTAVLFGNPSFKNEGSDLSLGNKVSSIEELPGAEQEIKEVTRLLARSNWKTNTYLQEDATETAVKKMSSPRVFHVATHGFFMQETKAADEKSQIRGEVADNPLHRSGLLFVDAGELLANNNIYDFNKKPGILTAYEAMNLNLDHTELVVLSACETGVGEIKSGEGVYGLQRSFIVAGAQNVIMTLFKVNDKVTQELMNDFYSNWLESGDKRRAFNDAKKRIKEKYNEPIFWGSFVLIGLD